MLPNICPHFQQRANWSKADLHPKPIPEDGPASPADFPLVDSLPQAGTPEASSFPRLRPPVCVSGPSVCDGGRSRATASAEQTAFACSLLDGLRLDPQS